MMAGNGENGEEGGKKKRELTPAQQEKKAAKEAAAAELEQNQQYLEDEAKERTELGNPVSLGPKVDEEDEPEESSEEHVPPLIYEGTFVVLAASDNLPEEVHGHEAVITRAPMKNSDGDEKIPYPHQYQDEDTVFTVRTRDEYSATLNAKLEDFASISGTGGRTGLGHAG